MVVKGSHGIAQYFSGSCKVERTIFAFFDVNLTTDLVGRISMYTCFEVTSFPYL